MRIMVPNPTTRMDRVRQSVAEWVLRWCPFWLRRRIIPELMSLDYLERTSLPYDPESDE